jgi:ATP-binding cassette subfamily C protein
MKVIIRFARAYPWQSAGVLLALVLAGTAEGVSLTALLPVLTAAITTERGIGGQSTAGADLGPGQWIMDILRDLGVDPSTGVLLGVIVLGIVLRSLLMLIANKRVGDTVAQVATDLRLTLLRALLFTRWEYYLRQPVGSLANAMSTEPDRASKAFLYGATLAAAIIQLVAYSWVAVLVSWQATVAYLGAGGLILFSLHRLVRMARRAGRRQTKLLKSLLGQMTDSLQSVKPLKAMARAELADTVLAAQTKELNRALRREVFSKEALRAVQYPAFATLVAIGLYVGLEKWQLPVATVMVLIVLLARVLNNLGKVQTHYQNLVTAESAFWSVQRTIEEAQAEVEPALGSRPPHLERGIELRGIHFTYGQREVLRNASLLIPAGALITLVGFSGAGKTTVLDLVVGLLRPQKGRVWIDGLPLEDIDLFRWRRAIGYVPQENLLLHDSVLHNVTLGDPELDADDAEQALRDAGAWDFVAALPQGLYSTAGERGTKLSGGQRQRIMIARALVHRPKLLILDEATSALDPASEAAICDTLQRLRGDITILAISHQPALVNAADLVYRLEKGSVVQMTRERLAVGDGQPVASVRPEPIARGGQR